MNIRGARLVIIKRCNSAVASLARADNCLCVTRTHRALSRRRGAGWQSGSCRFPPLFSWGKRSVSGAEGEGKDVPACASRASHHPKVLPGFLTGACSSSAHCFRQHRRSVSDELHRAARPPGTCACRRKHASASRFLFQPLLNFRKKEGNKSSRAKLKSAGEGQARGSSRGSAT